MPEIRIMRLSITICKSIIKVVILRVTNKRIETQFLNSKLSRGGNGSDKINYITKREK